MYAELHSLFMPGVSSNGGIVGLFKRRMVSGDFGRGSELPFFMLLQCLDNSVRVQWAEPGLKIALGEP